jgi:hypothetical protein
VLPVKLQLETEERRAQVPFAWRCSFDEWRTEACLEPGTVILGPYLCQLAKNLYHSSSRKKAKEKRKLVTSPVSND